MRPHHTREESVLNDEEIKREARFQALEYLVCNLHKNIYQQALPGDPVAGYRTGANELRAQYAAFTVPNIDPVLSDHVSGELGDALDRLLQLIGEMLGVGKSTT